MTGPIPKLDIKKKTGREHFHLGGSLRNFDVLDYWRWVNSDLVSNASRGILAEYIVAKAVGVSTTGVRRDEWIAYDLETPDGIKLEVKASAYIQSWWQARLSNIRFGTKKTLPWNAETNTFGTEPTRDADIYVFALLAHKDYHTIDPLDLDQWTFYVLPTAQLEERKGSQSSISLSALTELAAPVPFDELRGAVYKAHASCGRESPGLSDDASGSSGL